MSADADRSVRHAILGATVIVAAGLVLLPGPVAGLEPSPGVAVVDGSPAEWTPDDDVAALVGNDPPHLERGRLSLRYDCDAEVLYALLAAGPGLRWRTDDPDEMYLRLGQERKLVSGTDVGDTDAQAAAWVDLRDGTAAGIELSAPLAPGRHTDLRVHAKVRDDSGDGYETVDLLPRFAELDVACADPAAAAQLSLADPPADPPADPGDPPGLARTGAPALPALAVGGGLLLAAGAALCRRRWRPARL